ncbi:MAG: histidine kinase, partial [Bacteroidota bacterium]
MKYNINTMLPIALAVILPIISMYSNSDLQRLNYLEIISSWFTGSAVIYILWYIVRYMMEKENKHKVKWLIGLLAVITISIIVLSNIIEIRRLDSFDLTYIGRFALGIVLMYTIQYALNAQKNISLLQLEKEQIQTENYKVQLQALRAKIDPHFLFNSLNTLRSMVRQQHANSEQFIMSLSQFYRQTLRHNEDTTIRLSEELEVLKSYLFLMKNRNEEASIINLDIDKELYEHHLPTLALQIVLENCFKHNSMTSKNPLSINISNTEDYYIVVSNNIQAKLGSQETSGYGLDLLRKRYDLLNV